MPPLLCPSPLILDQTFPRSVQELQTVRTALGNLVLCIDQDKCALLLTLGLREFIIALDEAFDWSRIAQYPQLQVIYHILAQLGLQQHGVHTVDVSSVTDFVPHPLPSDCRVEGFSSDWSGEVGRLLALHSTVCTSGRFFIGCACTLAFAGEPLGTYNNPGNHPTFPLVGPEMLEQLDDHWGWDVPSDISQRLVSFTDAKKRIKLLGGSVKSPSGSSHYTVHFKGGRTWPLDCNLTTIPDDFLKQLEPITGFPLAVIKYVLLSGEWPARKSKIPIQ